MALRIRFQFQTGSSLGYSIERLSDGLYYDFATSGATAGTFTVSPTTPIAPLPEDTGNFAGRFRTTLTTTPTSQFSDGNYCVTVHNTAASNAVVAELGAQMHSGDDAPVFPGASGGGDPWSTVLPGSYPAGTAGAILGGNLDAKVSTRLPSTSYSASPTGAQIASAVWTDTTAADFTVANSAGDKLAKAALVPDPWAVSLPGNYASGTAGAIVGGNLDVKVSTRSVYAGGPVASVTAPVTVGTNNDKGGYLLAAAGLDAITVEAGVNARQALSPILASAAGTLTGAGTGTIIIKGGNVTTTRIVASTDSSGNRTSVTLALPA